MAKAHIAFVLLQLFYFGITDMGNTICPGYLVAGTYRGTCPELDLEVSVIALPQ
jgi:hypothetical protein